MFKVYMRDCGLFVGMLEDGTQYDILQGNLQGYKGAIFENLIADIFAKMGRKLYYFHKDFSDSAQFQLHPYIRISAKADLQSMQFYEILRPPEMSCL